MKRREYAITLGLAKPGRGKLSREAHAAINKAIAEGKVFSDAAGSATNTVANVRPVASDSGSGESACQPAPPVGKVVAQPIPDLPVTHQQSTVWGIDDNGRSALVIAFDSCAACGRAIKYCLHPVPILPNYMGGGPSLLVKPVI